MIAYMTRADGLGSERWGSRGLLLVDAALTGAGIVVLLALVTLIRSPAKADPAVAEPLDQGPCEHRMHKRGGWPQESHVMR